MLKLSIGMIVKNEEANLERCLSSLQPLMQAVPSELIIVDTGSTDGTVSIAQKYTDKIYFHPWENDYGKMRNFTVDYAGGEWFFFIDADEEIVTYKPMVDFLLRKNSRQFNAATVQLRSFYKSSSEETFSVMSAMRLFRKTKDFCFTGVIHEQPKFQMPFYTLETLLNHYGYVNDNPALKERKLQLYEPMLLKALEENPLDAYYWYQLSRTYSSYKDNESALEPAIKAYDIIKEQKLNPNIYSYAFTNLSHLYLINKNPEKSIEIAQEGLNLQKGLVDLWFYMAKARVALVQLAEAIESYEKHLFYVARLEQGLEIELSVVSYSITAKEEAWFDLSILYNEVGRKEDAIKAIEKLYSAERLKNAIPHAIELSLDLQKYKFLKAFYEKIKAMEDISLREAFYRILEENLLKCGDRMASVSPIFRQEDTGYGLLHQVRGLKETGIADANILQSLRKLDMNQLDSYYGDLIYFVLIRKHALDFINLEIEEQKLEQFFLYLDAKYRERTKTYLNYLQHYGDVLSPEKRRIIKIILRKILLVDVMEETQYESLLNRYIEEGNLHLAEIYNKELLTEDKAHLLKNQEDIFLLYAGLSKQLEATDQAGAARALRKALQVYPEMKRGVEFLVKRISDQVKKAKPVVNDEMAAYAQIVKRNIRQMLNQKMYKEAKEIIVGFEEILPGDVDIQAMKMELEGNGVQV